MWWEIIKKLIQRKHMDDTNNTVDAVTTTDAVAETPVVNPDTVTPNEDGTVSPDAPVDIKQDAEPVSDWKGGASMAG